ncbi:amidase [Sporolactobacillus sp. THM7-7]|nr:amidase [Sporolactobacillus sp. THM7-7]
MLIEEFEYCLCYRTGGGSSVNQTIAHYRNQLRKKEISPKELTEHFFKEISKKEDKVHAWVRLVADQALAQAEELENDRSSDAPPPLYGIPFGAKDIFYTKNVATEAGSKVLKDFIPDEDATIIKRLKSSGAILLGKTTMTEFATLSHPPETRNPWNLNHTPGGSSSGSAAALASGMALFTLGTQTRGSLLRPAAYNGLTCLKGTFGRVSKKGVVPCSWTLDHVGAMTHTVEDTVIVYNVISGKDDQDLSTYYLPSLHLTLREKRDYKIGILTGQVFRNTSPDVQSAMQEAIRGLKTIGYKCKEVQLPGCLDEDYQAHDLIEQAEFGAFHAKYYSKSYNAYDAYLQHFIRDSFKITAKDYLNAQNKRIRFREELIQLFKRSDVDVLISPTTPTTAPKGTESTGSPAYNMPFTNAGVPALTIPIGYSKETHLPIGMQIVSPTFEEQRVIDIGYMYQHITDWHERSPELAID